MLERLVTLLRAVPPTVAYRALLLSGLVLCAYWQARGIAALVVDGSIAPTSTPRAVVAAPRPATPASPSRSSRSAEVILARNPFDSVTGPLNGVATSIPVPPPPPELADPLSAPRCESVRVYSTAESTDPEFSIAVAQAKGAPRGQLVRVGDAVGALQVAYIGYNAVELSPSVWFHRDRGLCQSLVFSERPRFPSALAKARPAIAKKPPPKKPARKAKPPRKKRVTPPKLSPALAKSIEQISPTEFRVARSAVDSLIGQATTLVRGTRFIPTKGAQKGFRLVNVGKASLLGKLGLRDGDQLMTINGFDLASPEKALKAYARLKSASDIDIVIKRGGKPVGIDIHLR